MKKLNSIWPKAVLVLAVLLLLGTAEIAHGQDVPSTTREIDVVIVLDDSGSMATCWPWAGTPRPDNCPESQNPPSDPLNLRYSAARLLVQLADDKDRVGVIRFNAETEDVIGQLQAVGSRNSRQSLVESIQAPTDYEKAGGYTRIDLGLQKALQILVAAKSPDRPSYVLLLTDGVPTQPGNVPAQDKAIKQTMAGLQSNGTQVFPVFLCNEKAGCPDDAFVRQTMGQVPEKAKTADDLLQVFSAIFAQMKPDLHVVDQRNTRGELQFTVRPAHGAQQLVIVAEKNGLVALKRDGDPETVSQAYQDSNILVNVIEASKLAAGTWTVETRGRSSFAVVQTETVPELTYPPSSVPGSAAAPHYVPTGKPVIILAKVVGPGSGEPLRLDGTTPLEPLAPGDPVHWAVLPGGTGRFTLQVGEDTQPLQIKREFRLEARSDLPAALALSPGPGTACPSGEPCPLKVGFGPGPDAEDVQAIVYVTDASQEDALVYSAPMTCTGRECFDPGQAFKRLDGHTYTIRFLLRARSAGVWFGDWAETTLAMEPAVYLRGLPVPLNLKAQPSGGWPVTVTVGTTEDLGQLRANIALTRTEDSTPVRDAEVAFVASINSPGEQHTTLRVELPAELRPGNYGGQISFIVDKPAAGRKVRLPSPIPVNLNLARPAAQVMSATVDFGNIVFDTSPNFRVDQTASIDVQYSEAPFNLTPTLANSTCRGLELVAKPPQVRAKSYQVTLNLRSSGPVSPQTCSGTFTLRGPSEDYDVLPGTPMSWRLVIPAVEWKLTGIEHNGTSAKDAVFDSLGQPGERSNAVLLVHYTGQPPFSLELSGLHGEADRGSATIGNSDVELVAAPVTPQPGTTDVYRVPVEVLVRRPLPHGTLLAAWLFGTDYNGTLQLDIVGLPASIPQEISFRLHNPSRYQRYIQPFYRWWWPGILTCPLSLLIPLVLFALAWKRKKDADVGRLMRKEARPEVVQPQEERPGPAPRIALDGLVADLPAPRRPEEAPGPSVVLARRGGHSVPKRSSRPAVAAARGSTAPASGTAASAAKSQASADSGAQRSPLGMRIPAMPPRRSQVTSKPRKAK